MLTLGLMTIGNFAVQTLKHYSWSGLKSTTKIEKRNLILLAVALDVKKIERFSNLLDKRFSKDPLWN